jgi:hypothetical protein
VAIALALAACRGDRKPVVVSAAEHPLNREHVSLADVAAFSPLPLRPRAGASEVFWQQWGDQRAEIASYRGVAERYGELRPATWVVVTVVEPHDRRTWIKQDHADEAQRVYVLKSLQHLRFQTGTYPYSVATIAICPLEAWLPHRFAPTKISATVQEWCGHVYHGIWPGEGQLLSHLVSYFESEGQGSERIIVDSAALYEDALPLMLRELDGPFNEGRPWEGALVPSLWSTRKRHVPLRAERARIERHAEQREGVAVVRFVVSSANATRTFIIEAAGERRLLALQLQDGTQLELQGSARLAYWQHHAESDALLLRELGVER